MCVAKVDRKKKNAKTARTDWRSLNFFSLEIFCLFAKRSLVTSSSPAGEQHTKVRQRQTCWHDSRAWSYVNRPYTSWWVFFLCASRSLEQVGSYLTPVFSKTTSRSAEQLVSPTKFWLHRRFAYQFLWRREIETHLAVSKMATALSQVGGDPCSRETRDWLPVSSWPTSLGTDKGESLGQGHQLLPFYRAALSTKDVSKVQRFLYSFPLTHSAPLNALAAGRCSQGKRTPSQNARGEV